MRTQPLSLNKITIDHLMQAITIEEDELGVTAWLDVSAVRMPSYSSKDKEVELIHYLQLFDAFVVTRAKAAFIEKKYPNEGYHHIGPLKMLTGIMHQLFKTDIGRACTKIQLTIRDEPMDIISREVLLYVHDVMVYSDKHHIRPWERVQLKPFVERIQSVAKQFHNTRPTLHDNHLASFEASYTDSLYEELEAVALEIVKREVFLR